MKILHFISLNQQKAVLKNEQADELEGDADNANDEIVQDKKRSEEIKKLLKGWVRGLLQKLNTTWIVI